MVPILLPNNLNPFLRKTLPPLSTLHRKCGSPFRTGPYVTLTEKQLLSYAAARLPQSTATPEVASAAVKKKDTATPLPTMNYLGHLYLAGKEKQIRFGNFIADNMKGIPITSYPQRIQDGIMVHRAIDYFTDSHPGLAQLRDLLRPGYQKYAGVVLDVALDYFIIDQWNRLSPQPLRPFIWKFYLEILSQWNYLPPYWKKKGRILRIILQDRLWRYRRIAGICESLDIMAATTSLPDASSFAREVLLGEKQTFQQITYSFMVDIVAHIDERFGIQPIGWATIQVQQDEKRTATEMPAPKCEGRIPIPTICLPLVIESLHPKRAATTASSDGAA